jgi:Tfp pilus assembly protein PilW
MGGLTRRVRDEHGVSLVEVLVAMVLSLAVGGIATQAVVANLQAQRRLTYQTHVLSGAKTALERVTRDVRGANPLSAATPAAATVEIVDGGQRRTVSYWLCPPGALCALSGATAAGQQLAVNERTTDATTGAVVSDPPARLLLDGIAMPSGTGIFRYFAADGTELTGTLTAAQLPAVRSLTTRLRMPLVESGNAVDLENQIMLRNAGG